MSTGIQWTDETWNPIRGCSRVSDGCKNCYAEGIAARFSGPGLPYEGLARRRSNGEPQWTGEVRVARSHVTDPIRWRKPRRVFVNSMSDFFHDAVSDATLDELFAVMAVARHHTYQILTKRPDRMLYYLGDEDRLESIYAAWSSVSGTAPELEGWPLPNVWLGVSVEHQAAADERIPLLLETPAAIRFLSCEPLLDRVDLDREHVAYAAGNPSSIRSSWLDRLDWVIVGGESGRNARPFDIAWARSIVAQCRSANAAPFVKQLGRRPIANGEPLPLPDSHGSYMPSWPEDLRVREFPRERSRTSVAVHA